MNIQFADIVPIIVALIGLAGIVYSSRQGKRKKPTSPPKRLDPNKALFATSVVLFTASFVVFGWRYWGRSSECNELNIPIDSVPVPIAEGGVITPTITTSGDLEIDFRNGQGYSGVVLLTPALDVQGCTHLDINGTSTEDVKLTVEYKAPKGKIVAKSEYNLFPASSEPQTVRVPLEYGGRVDEIALMFHVEGEASKVTIESINLK